MILFRTHPIAITVLTFQLGAPAASVGAADIIARGTVYEDANRNGQRDTSEPGVAGVPVSNQIDVVLTDEAGRYALPVTDDTILFVTKPSGYSVPLSPHMLPRFYYLHKPNGSPTQQYRGVDPTGPLPVSIDFPLQRAGESDDFSIVVLADPQPETSQEVEYIRDDILTELANLDVVFGVTLGDIVSDRLDLYSGYNDLVGKIGIPFYNVIGNHDENYDANNDANSDETFCRLFGPNYYSWNYGKVHFVALDDVEWLGRGKGSGNYQGRVVDPQLTWLANDLAVVPHEHLVVLLMHIPLASSSVYRVKELSKLLSVVSPRASVLALAGHAHYQEHVFLGADDGWTGDEELHLVICAAASGSWWSGPKDVRGIPVADQRDGTPNGYNLVTFKGTEYITDFKAAGAPSDHQMRIYPPGCTTGHDLARRRLMVNVFDGNDRCKVVYSLDNAPFSTMTQSPGLDPFAVALLSGVTDSGKPWANPAPTRHLWTADLAEPPARGTHIVSIRVTDHFGRLREQSKIFTFR